MIELSKSKIEEFCKDLALDNMSQHTVRAYKADLMALLNAETPSSMDGIYFSQRCQRFLNARSDAAPSTIRRQMASFRRFAQWQGLTSIMAHYKPPTAAPPEPHPLPEGIAGVIAMANAATLRRHKALIALCGLCGLRVGEAIQVQPLDISEKGGTERTLLVRGKGRKLRRVPVSSAAWKFLQPAIVTAVELKQSLTGDIKDRPARAAITRIGKKALKRDNISSHDLRATFATAAYAKTKNLRVVQELLGHADSHTTETYTGVTRDEMIDAADLVDLHDLPY